MSDADVRIRGRSITPPDWMAIYIDHFDISFRWDDRVVVFTLDPKGVTNGWPLNRPGLAACAHYIIAKVQEATCEVRYWDGGWVVFRDAE